MKYGIKKPRELAFSVHEPFKSLCPMKVSIQEVLKPVAVAILGGASAKADDVKHGAHQVTAAPQGAGVPGAASVSLELFPAGPGVVPVLDG